MSPTAEFGSEALTDQYREEHPDHLCPDDDARLKSVTFTSDAPDWLLRDAPRGEENVSVSLSESERDWI